MPCQSVSQVKVSVYRMFPCFLRNQERVEAARSRKGPVEVRRILRQAVCQKQKARMRGLVIIWSGYRHGRISWYRKQRMPHGTNGTRLCVNRKIPFAVFLMIRFLAAIPSVLTETASLAGVGDWQIFIHMGLPFGVPGILSAVVLGFIFRVVADGERTNWSVYHNDSCIFSAY